MTILTLWVLLLSPGLCLAGVLEHFCVDSPQGDSCEHEDFCASDPCGELLIVKASDPDIAIVVPVGDWVSEMAEDIDATAVEYLATLFPLRLNLPLPTADLPLLI